MRSYPNALRSRRLRQRCARAKRQTGTGMLSTIVTPGVVPRHRREPSPERVLGRPQVRRLARERGAVHGPQPGEQVAEVAPEVGVQAPVRVEAEDLADDLDRQHLAVGEDRRRATLTEPTVAAQVADEVVHEAEDGDDEGLQVHSRPSLRLNLCKERPGATMAPSATQSLGNPHTGLAGRHGRAVACPGPGRSCPLYGAFPVKGNR